MAETGANISVMSERKRRTIDELHKLAEDALSVAGQLTVSDEAETTNSELMSICEAYEGLTWGVRHKENESVGLMRYREGKA